MKMSTMTTATYTSGYMVGDIKGAWLASTDDTDVVSTELVTNGDDFVGVVNGTTTLPSGASNVGWYASSDGTYSVTGSTLTITNGTNGRTGFYWPISVVEGAVYEADWVAQTGGIQVRITDTINPNDTSPLRVHNLGSTGKKSFVSPSSTLYVSVTNYSMESGYVGSLDKISVRLVEADRSVNGNGLQVLGTVTKTPVATGADLVAYSGFSSSNYLEQPYNSDLDFGTGDFSIMYWIYNSNTNNDTHLDCTESDGSRDNGFWILGGTDPYLRTFNGGAQSSFLSNPRASLSTGWSHVAFNVTDSGTKVTMFVNGVDTGTDTGTGRSIDAVTTRILRVGVRVDGTYSVAGSMALLRISATAPTAQQITKIYNDEKVLFQENAQATLYGSSDAVKALAHDDTTDLLHVGTSAGRSVFQGLRRVSNTTTAVGTAISASNNLIVEE